MNDFRDNKLSALIGIGGVLLSVFIFILSARTESRALAIVGLVLFVAAIAAGKITEKVTASSVKAKYVRGLSDNSAKTTSKYQPLLMDERTKQDPDVQRLLQYLSVQKAFFDPNYLSTAEAQNDPYVRELTEVLDRMLGDGGANGDFGGYGNINQSSAYFTELNKREVERQQREKSKPRKIAGRIITAVGLIMFCLPFFAVFFNEFGGYFMLFFGAAPFGFVLVIIGSIIRK